MGYMMEPYTLVSAFLNLLPKSASLATGGAGCCKAFLRLFLNVYTMACMKIHILGGQLTGLSKLYLSGTKEGT
jgi:hypothetical protein